MPPLDDLEDIEAVVRAHLSPPALANSIAPRLLQFWTWYHHALSSPGKSPLSLRDMLAWCEFARLAETRLGADAAYAHGAYLVMIDGQGLGSGAGAATAAALRAECTAFLAQQVPPEAVRAAAAEAELPLCGESACGHLWGIAPFLIATGATQRPAASSYHLGAPTTARNCFRVLRAMQLRKPILLEGSPGVGKTSLVAAMAAAAGHELVRINVSEQTDIMDLLGADLPVASGAAGSFAWSDGPLLRAIKRGSWVLLDELNLASQSVLEGLNAVLDHRREVFLPELGETVRCPDTFRVFAAQNPVQEGGGRKGLPKSFINRFSRVALELLSAEDLRTVAAALHPSLAPALLAPMVAFVDALHRRVNVERCFGGAGAPWEFNLRDLLRWCDLVVASGAVGEAQAARAAGHYARMLFVERLRTPADRAAARALFASVWPQGSEDAVAAVAAAAPASKAYVRVDADVLRIGAAVLPRSGAAAIAGAAAAAAKGRNNNPAPTAVALADASVPALEWVACAAQHGWMALLATADVPRAANAVRTLARLCAQPLAELSLTPASDTADLLGSFEQVDAARARGAAAAALETAAEVTTRALLASGSDGPDVTAALDAAQRAAADAQAVQLLATPAQLQAALQRLRPVAAPLAATCSSKAVQQTLAAAAAAVDAACALATEAEQATLGGRFVWADGALLAAIEHGGWVMLRDPNTCSGAILDRLNSLLETSGFLYVNECGSSAGGPRVVEPHSDFRLFLVADPARGEVSRAMRNRGIEVFFPGVEEPALEAPPQLSSAQVCPSARADALPVCACQAGRWVTSQC